MRYRVMFIEILFLVFGVKHTGCLRWNPDNEMSKVHGLQGQPDPGRQVQVQGGQLRQQSLRLRLSVGQLAQPHSNRDEGLHKVLVQSYIQGYILCKILW